MTRLLLAAFEPFAGLAINPSTLVADRLAADPPTGFAVRSLHLPVVYARAWPLLAAALDDPPDIVLGLGLAGGADGLRVERVALNLDDAPVADEVGEHRRDRPILPDGPFAYASTLPVAAMAAAADAAGVPASVSISAGSFLCNHVFYRLCHHAATRDPGPRCGFVHLPWLPEQAARATAAEQPSLDLPLMVAGVKAALASVRDLDLEPDTNRVVLGKAGSLS